MRLLWFKLSNKTQNKKISGLVKKTYYDAKISEIEKKILDYNHDKYITTQELTKLVTDNIAARLK